LLNKNITLKNTDPKTVVYR